MTLICTQLCTTADAVESIPLHLDNGGYAVKKEGRLIVSHNPHKQFVPASIIKIATSLAALHILGPQYRFETRFYIDTEQNMYIRGFGDPYLVSEEVNNIVRELKKTGCDRINNIYLDDTWLEVSGSVDGAGLSDNPYDAQNSALAVNFNTVNIKKDSAGKIYSAEEQTPVLSLMAELAENVKPGVHRINISQDRMEGKAIISRYVGELFRAFQRRENIPGDGVIVRRKTPENMSIFYSHRSSKTLEDMIAPFMLYSNNFMANQLFLAIGAEQYGYPATWEKSRSAVSGILQREYDIAADSIRIVEGSGLSRNNRVTPDTMIRLLDHFKPYGVLLPEDGTRFVKSGTLKGVYSYGGYFRQGEKLDSFVLILNQESNVRDKLLLQLEQIYREN
ncbi:D-alanyl-D-alanine carboxypeptidase/D-alanyl-D-alanine-endopeptidase [Thermodesulfobacteriota bacterium]